MVCSNEDDDKKETPSDESKDAPKESEKSPEEEGVESANDFMKKFLKKNEG